MTLTAHLQLLAQYNDWMNRKLYDAASQLAPDALAADRGAFFGSILGTLNHLVVADTIWLQRMAAHPACAPALQAITAWPAPQRLDEILYADLPSLRQRRSQLDTQIIDFIGSLDEDVLASSLTYRNTRGVPFTRNLHALLVHVFNHQTHHRGQATTLLMQAGVDPGVTDLLALIPEVPTLAA